MSELAKRKPSELAKIEDSKSRIRLHLRKLFETDQNIKEVLEFSKPASEASQHLVEMLKERFDDPLLTEVIDELLEELERQRIAGPSLYLIDQKTGKPVVQLREGAIYQPPDYIGEDGIQRKAKPILHPGISAPLIMKAHEDGKLSLAAENPKSLKALTAIIDPSSITRYAEMKLREMGYDVGPVENGIVEIIEIGREYYDPMQSRNDQFHRHSMFGALLAKKVADKMGSVRKCELSPAMMERNSKQRWYKVTVKYGS